MENSENEHVLRRKGLYEIIKDTRSRVFLIIASFIVLIFAMLIYLIASRNSEVGPPAPPTNCTIRIGTPSEYHGGGGVIKKHVFIDFNFKKLAARNEDEWEALTKRGLIKWPDDISAIARGIVAKENGRNQVLAKMIYNKVEKKFGQ